MSPPASKGPTKARGAPRERRRRYHLGLDWGTSCAKLVLRDYDDPSADHGRAYVLRPDGQSFRYPSTVTLQEGRLWFGHEAERRRDEGYTWDSLKARAAVERNWDSPAEDTGLSLEDLATLSVAHFVALGLAEAQRMAEAKGATPRLGITLSVPVASLQMPRTQESYLRVAATGYRLAVGMQVDPQGASVKTLRTKLSEARESALEGLSDVSYDTYLRAEVVAAMLWPFMSPRVGEGAYTVIDVGAATTNASWFRIHGGRDADGHYRKKASMSFFGAHTSAPGMDEFDRVLGGLLNRPMFAVRGRETQLIQKFKQTTGLAAVVQRFHDVWAEARRNMWPKSKRLEHWEGLQIMVVGGGPHLAMVRDRFDELPGYFKGQLKKVERLRKPGVPGDLFELSTGSRYPKAFEDDPTFLLVAYGLSYHTGDMPEVSLPSQVSPFRRQEIVREFKSSEELGYDT